MLWFLMVVYMLLVLVCCVRGCLSVVSICSIEGMGFLFRVDDYLGYWCMVRWLM